MFCHFRISHTSLLPIFLTSLSPFSLHKLIHFLVLSFIPLTWWSLWAKRCSAFYPIRLFSSSGNVYRIVFWRYLKTWRERTWMLPFSSFSSAPVLRGTWTPFSTNHFYVPPLSHLSLLCFVNFVFLTPRCYLYFLLRCYLFLFINSYTFWYYPFLSPDEAPGRNVVLHSILSVFLRLLEMSMVLSSVNV